MVPTMADLMETLKVPAKPTDAQKVALSLESLYNLDTNSVFQSHQVLYREP